MLYIIHHNDADGIFSAMIATQFAYNTIYINFNYGQEYKLDELIDKLTKEDIVYVLDLSLNENYISLLNEKSKELIWIDHHVTSLEHNSHIKGIRSIDRSGAYLTYEYFKEFGNKNNGFIIIEFAKEVPYLIKLVDDYDRWIHKYNESKYFSKWFGQFEWDLNDGVDLEGLVQLLENTEGWLDNAIKLGGAIYYYDINNIKKKLNQFSYEVEIDDNGDIINGLAFNGLSSGLYMDCVKELHGDKYKFFVSYWYNQGKWTLSFRGNEYPIINVAKSLGGGGHAYACGATVEHLPKFLNVNI